MKNALNNQVGTLGDVFLWLVANLKQGVIYFIKQHSPQTFQPGVYDATENQDKIRFVWQNRGIVCFLVLYLNVFCKNFRD